MEIDPEKIALKDALFAHGNVVVEAAPGTGKTFAGVYLALEAYRAGWIKGRQKALIITFSRNARIQIEEEIDKFLAEKQLTKEEAKYIYASNYHSLYYEILQKHKGFWGITKLRPATVDEENKRGESSQDILSGIKDGTPRYSDFPSLILQLLKVSPTLLSWLRTSYPFVVLDEFQDTDSIQWEILRLWKPINVAVFYDRFQMIYAFRDADINNIQKIIDEYHIPDSARINLTKIHRVNPQNSLSGYISELRTDNLGGNSISTTNPRTWLILKPCNKTQQPRLFVRCASQIRYNNRLIDTSESTAIITITSALAKSLQNNLSRKSTGAVKWYCSCRLITGKNDTTEELRDSLIKFRKCNTAKSIRALIGELFNNMLLSNDSICFKEEFKKGKVEMLAGRRDRLLVKMREDYQAIYDDVRKNNIKGIGSLFDYLVKYGRQYVADESTLDIDWYYYIKQFAKISNAFPPSSEWDKYCDALENEILVQSHFRRKATKGITIMNAHQSKGRQFDHVILPWLSENGESPSIQRSGKKFDYSLDEDRRLLYVAITRAKKKVTIIYPEENPADILKKWKLI